MVIDLNVSHVGLEDIRALVVQSLEARTETDSGPAAVATTGESGASASPSARTARLKSFRLLMVFLRTHH